MFLLLPHVCVNISDECLSTNTKSTESNARTKEVKFRLFQVIQFKDLVDDNISGSWKNVIVYVISVTLYYLGLYRINQASVVQSTKHYQHHWEVTHKLPWFFRHVCVKIKYCEWSNFTRLGLYSYSDFYPRTKELYSRSPTSHWLPSNFPNLLPSRSGIQFVLVKVFGSKVLSNKY